MKKINKFFPREFVMPLLYKDDLIEIENIIKNDAKPEDYEIQTDLFEDIHSVSELFSKRIDINKLELKCNSPYLSLSFGKYSTNLWGNDKDNNALAAAYKISSLLEKRERRGLNKFLNFWSYFGLIIPAQFFIWGRDISNKYYLISFIFISIISLVITIYSFYFSLRLRSFTIVAFEKNERTNWFKRKKDDIILGIFVALITAIFSFGVAWFFWIRG